MKAATLKELVEDGSISYGVVQPGGDDPQGVPILRVGDLEAGSLAGALPEMRVASAVEAAFARTRLRGGEVVVSLVGSPGRTAVVPKSLSGWNVARALAVLRPHGVEAEWLVYALRSPICQAQITAALNTTVQATLNLADLRKIKIPLAERETRMAIAEVLGALDDKIAANAQVSSSADALVRAMVDGLQGAEMSNVAALSTNPRIQASPPFEESAYVGLEHVPRRHMWMNDYGTPVALASGKFRFEPGDILFGKLRPYFHKVVVADRSGICSTDILVVRPRVKELAGFVWAVLSSDSVVERVSTMTEGTRMPRTNWADLAACEVPWPGDDEARRISDAVLALGSRAAAAQAESRHLAQLRDALLPHLMSGRITVRQAELLVEASGSR